MDQLLKLSRGRLKFFGLLIVAAVAMPASGVDVGKGAVEVSLPAVTDELPEPEGVLDGDCMNISLKNSDWSWNGVDGQQAEGETALLLRRLIKRLNNATQRIHDDNPNLNSTQFINVVASRSSLLLLKIKSFARVFGQINSFYGYTCRNGKDLLRHALNRNITADESEDFDDELAEEIDAAIHEVMGDDNGDAEEGGEAEEEESGGEETEPGRGPGPKPNSKSLGMQNKTLAIRKRNKIAVRMFIKKALVALFLSQHRFKGSRMSLQEVIQRLGEDGRLGSIDQSKPRHVGGRNETADSTEVAGDDDGLTGIMGEDSDEIMDIFESVEWFDDEGDNSDVEDEEEVRRKFTLEGYLLKLMSVYVNKSASCARRVTRFIRQRAKHLPNKTDDEEEFTDLWKDYMKLVRQMNVSRHQQASDGSLRNGGENSSSEVEVQTGNPLQEDGPLVSRIRNITQRLVEGKWSGKGGIEGRFYVVVLKMAQVINNWGKAGFLTNGTYFDANCSPGRSSSEGATTTCRICPTDASIGNLRMLLSELDDTIEEVYDDIRDRVDRLTKGTPKEKLTVYRLPGLVLDEHMFTLSYEEECTPFRLTYTIPLSQEGARQTDGTDEEEDDAESERGGDGETREVITYDDFGAFRRGEQSLPEMPSLLNGKQANLAKGSSNMIRIDNSNFTTDRQLVISGRLCGLGSRLLLLCPTIDGRSRIRTDDAPSGKCHNVSVYVEAPTISSARLSNEGDGIIIFFNKNVAIKDLRKCSSIFDESTINQLGENAVCKWKDGKNLIVGLGCDTSITTGSSITLRPDRIKAARSTFSHTASGTVNVLAPNDPKPPMAVIDGRPKVPSCGQFALSGRASTGGRSCGLTYEWALVSPTEDVDSRLTDKIQEANDANNDRMVSTTEALPEVTPYTFRLTVTNKLGLSNSTEFTMRKSNVREPWLEIQKSGNIKGTKVSANKKFGIIAQFTFEQATGCEKLAASRAEYQWSVEGVEFDEDALRKRGLRFLPSNLGGASEIAATVTVTYGSPTDQNTKSASVTLTVVKAPLRARIKGGGRITIGTASDSVDLDCSYSEDPSYQGDEPDPGLEFRWECWDETSKNTCDLPSSQEDADVAILTIEPSLLSVDKTYSISCYVNKAGFDEVHDSVKVSVTEGSPPRVSLALLGSKEGSYKPGQDVEIRVMFSGMYNETVLEDLRGGLDGIGDLQYTNIIDKTREDQETAESSSQDSSSDKPYQLTVSKKMTRYTVLVKIDKSILTPGSQYSLGVKVVSESSEGLAEIDFNVYDRVTGCTFEFGVNGDYEDTASDVTYEVSGCSVESLEGLTYRAFAQFRSKKRLLGETSQDSTFTVDHEVLDIVKKSIEAGDAVDFKVGVKVCNTTSGVCSEFLKNATYAMGTLSDEELDEEKQEIQDLKLEGRSVEGLKKANRAQKAKASQTTGVDRKKRAAPDCDQVLLDLQYELLMEATSDEANYNYNPGDVLGMLQADTDVPITCLTLEQQRSTLASTKRVLESARDLEDRLPPETVDGVRQQLEDAKMVYPDAFFFSENRDIFGLLTKGMSKNMALGEKVTSFGESMFISMDYTLNTDAIPISRGDGNIIFLGGDDIKDRFDTSWVGCGCEECVGILLESIVFRGQDYVGGESHDSDVFRLQFFSPCADSTDPIEVRDLSDPIRFWYPVSAQPNDRPVCSFLDQGTDEWSQAGLEAAIDGTDVRCETNHTTEYVVDLINESGQSTSTLPEVTDATTAGDEDDDDDDDDGGHIDIAGINGLIGLGVGVIVGVVVAVIVVLAAVIILIVVVVKHVNKPKMIVEPVVKA